MKNIQNRLTIPRCESRLLRIPVNAWTSDFKPPITRAGSTAGLKERTVWQSVRSIYLREALTGGADGSPPIAFALSFGQAYRFEIFDAGRGQLFS